MRPAGWAKDDIAVIVSDDQIIGANPDRAAQYKGDRARIAAVIGNYLYTTMPLRETFTTNIRVARMTQRDVILDDLMGEDEFGSPSGRYSPFLNIRGAVAPRLSNWQPRHLMSMGVKFEGCVGGRINGLDALDLRTFPDNAYGYGAVLVSCNDFTVRGADGDMLRHIVTTGQGSNMTANSPDMHRYGRCIGINIVESHAHQVGHAAYDFHEEAMDCTIDGCSVDWNHREPDGTAAAYQLRGIRTAVMNSRSRGPGGVKMYAYDGGGDFRLTNYHHELVAGIYGTSAFGLQFDNSGTASATRPKAKWQNVTLLARGAEVSVVQLTKALVHAKNLHVEAYNAAALTAFRPFLLTDSELTGDVEMDLAGITGTVRGFFLADSTSAVRLDALKVSTGGVSWGIGHFNSLNGNIAIGRVDCDFAPVSTLFSNIGASATWNIGDVIVNGQSRKDGVATYTNSTAAATLNALAFGRQTLTGPLTAARTLKEPPMALRPGQTIRYNRPAAATGAFPWTIGDGTNGTPDALTGPGMWLDRTCDNPAAPVWYTSAKGTL